MVIEDAALPAVVHLTGDGAADVLDAAVRVSGGTLIDVRVSQIQYRPGREAVVRYRCDVDWPSGRRSDTLLAAATSAGPLPGAVPVVAETEDGVLEVSVWRWPFDPVLPGLATAVTAAHLITRLQDLGVGVDAAAELDVLAYRPTERAVVRVRSPDGASVYVKAVPPATAAALAERHRTLLGADLPVPPVLAVDEAAGLLALAEVPGTTLRDRIKGGLGGWPEPAAFVRLSEQLSAVPRQGLPRAGCRLRDAIGHADLLRAVTPENEWLLDRIVPEVAAQVPIADARSRSTIHGDLHESQVIVDDGRITGLLDVDDVGIGDPVTDIATLAGHLRFRALLDEDPARAASLSRYAGDLRRSLAARVDRHGVDVAIAGVLVGLATGPFRIQRAGWRDEVATVLSDASALAVPADEEVLRPVSRPSRVRARG